MIRSFVLPAVAALALLCCVAPRAQAALDEEGLADLRDFIRAGYAALKSNDCPAAMDYLREATTLAEQGVAHAGANRLYEAAMRHCRREPEPEKPAQLTPGTDPTCRPGVNCYDQSGGRKPESRRERLRRLLGKPPLGTASSAAPASRQAAAVDAYKARLQQTLEAQDAGRRSLAPQSGGGATERGAPGASGGSGAPAEPQRPSGISESPGSRVQGPATPPAPSLRAAPAAPGSTINPASVGPADWSGAKPTGSNPGAVQPGTTGSGISQPETPASATTATGSPPAVVPAADGREPTTAEQLARSRQQAADAVLQGSIVNASLPSAAFEMSRVETEREIAAILQDWEVQRAALEREREREQRRATAGPPEPLSPECRAWFESFLAEAEKRDGVKAAEGYSSLYTQCGEALRKVADAANLNVPVMPVRKMGNLSRSAFGKAMAANPAETQATLHALRTASVPAVGDTGGYDAGEVLEVMNFGLAILGMATNMYALRQMSRPMPSYSAPVPAPRPALVPRQTNNGGGVGIGPSGSGISGSTTR